MSLTGFLVGLVGIILGFLMVWKPGVFLEFIGEQEWANKIIGEGHGETAYKVIGLIIIFLSFLIMFGLIQGIIIWIFGPVIGVSR